MANPEHLKLVRQGADATWNWRGGRLDLRNADLSDLALRGALLDQADLTGARLVGTDLSGSRLQEASLSGAHLIRARLTDAQLGGARLCGALLCSASLRGAVLVRCDLTGANLSGADCEDAVLSHARLAGAIFDRTKLLDAELDEISGLDQVVHEGPSELGTHALLRFGHEMPASFLRGIGLPDGFIRYLPSIIASARPVDFYSTYICAAPGDSELARRLFNDLQAAGIRCWVRQPHTEWSDLDDTVRLHQQSIVLYSESAIQDSAVQAELLRSHRPGSQRAIFLQLDHASFAAPTSVPRFDFTRWKDFRAYLSAFDSLLQFLLQPEESTTPGSTR